jgi:hypothetical protein
VPAATWALYDLQALKTAFFSSTPLSSEIYAALGVIDDEIYILRLRSIPGPAKAFCPYLRGLTVCPADA